MMMMLLIGRSHFLPKEPLVPHAMWGAMSKIVIVIVNQWISLSREGAVGAARDVGVVRSSGGNPGE